MVIITELEGEEIFLGIWENFSKAEHWFRSEYALHGLEFSYDYPHQKWMSSSLEANVTVVKGWSGNINRTFFFYGIQ